jgi:hypothetical protein
MLLSMLIRCPKHLNVFLSNISVNGSWFIIPLSWLFLLSPLLVYPIHSCTSSLCL